MKEKNEKITESTYTPSPLFTGNAIKDSAVSEYEKAAEAIQIYLG